MPSAAGDDGVKAADAVVAEPLPRRVIDEVVEELGLAACAGGDLRRASSTGRAPAGASAATLASSSGCIAASYSLASPLRVSGAHQQADGAPAWAWPAWLRRVEYAVWAADGEEGAIAAVPSDFANKYELAAHAGQLGRPAVRVSVAFDPAAAREAAEASHDGDGAAASLRAHVAREACEALRLAASCVSEALCSGAHALPLERGSMGADGWALFDGGLAARATVAGGAELPPASGVVRGHDGIDVLTFVADEDQAAELVRCSGGCDSVLAGAPDFFGAGAAAVSTEEPSKLAQTVQARRASWDVIGGREWSRRGQVVALEQPGRLGRAQTNRVGQEVVDVYFVETATKRTTSFDVPGSVDVVFPGSSRISVYLPGAPLWWTYKMPQTAADSPLVASVESHGFSTAASRGSEAVGEVAMWRATLSRSLHKTGFHREVAYDVTVTRDSAAVQLEDCEVVLSQRVSTETYIDLDEIRTQARFGGVQLHSVVPHIEIERPASASTQHVAALRAGLPRAAAGSAQLAGSVRFPFHLRYQSPKVCDYSQHEPTGDGSCFSPAQLPWPSVFVRCGDDAGWQPAVAETATARADDRLWVPVGVVNHSVMVSAVTGAVAVGGAGLLVFFAMRTPEVSGGQGGGGSSFGGSRGSARHRRHWWTWAVPGKQT